MSDEGAADRMLCSFGCVHAKEPICACACGGKGHGVPVRRVLASRRLNRRDEYLATRFTRDSMFPLPKYGGVAIRELPQEALDYYVSASLGHRQLFGVLAQERQMRATESR